MDLLIKSENTLHDEPFNSAKLKTIGLIGGMSWRASMFYYEIINKQVNANLGKEHSAHVILYSLDFQPMIDAMYRDDWKFVNMKIEEALTKLSDAGADVIGICTNTMHKPLESINLFGENIIIHIADATAEKVKQHGITNVGLLGTRFVMSEEFYVRRLESHGLKVFVPSESEQELIQDIIFRELSVGHILPESEKLFLQTMEKLQKQGVDGFILGCTELNMIIHEHMTDLPLFDTTVIHAEATAQAALGITNH